MNRPLLFRAAAQRELNEAAVWYEKQRPGLGRDFVDRVQKVFDKIADQPDHYPLVSNNVREAPVSRFPYAVYYRVRPQQVVIIAVFHCSRDPAIWKRRS